MAKRLTTQEWIAKARAKHGDRYDYSKVVYTLGRNKVIIICSEHGEFQQNANSHTQGYNCPKCYDSKRGKSSRSTLEQWTTKARAKHGDFYDYSKVVYTLSRNKVTIICPKHGEFQQVAKEHHFYGCMECGKDRSRQANVLTRADWLATAKKTHGDKKFDYSLVPENVRGRDRVDIICEKGHKWNVKFQSHCYRDGCIKCYREIQGQHFRYSQEEWIEKARAKHGDYYDYSKVIYVGSHDPIIITCKYHGDFSQTPTQHSTAGHGCPTCGNKYSGIKSRLNQEQFLYKARQIHGDYYDLSQTTYTKGDEFIDIICPKHGLFQTRAINFLTGRGCTPCGRHRAAASRRITEEEWFKRVKEIHGDKYDYTATEYTISREWVTINCPKHGDFEIQANEHLHAKRGCQYCSRSILHPDDFIEDCIKVHGDKYDLSQVSYTGYNEYITPICPEHGMWSTMAGVFIRSDCPSCAKYGFNTQVPAHAYLIKYNTPDFVAYKQGITNQKIPQRMVSLRRSIKHHYPDAEIELVDSIYFAEGQQAKDLETRLKSISEIRFTPPVKFDGHTEMYNENIMPHWEEVK